MISQTAGLHLEDGTGGTTQGSHWTGLAGGSVAPQMTVGISASVSHVVCFPLQLGSSREERALCYPCDGVLVQDQLFNFSGAVVFPHLSSLPLHLGFQGQLVFLVAVI